MNHYTTFLQLHQQAAPFLLGNAWNASSAQALEKAGYKALGTSSAAIAHSLGYHDGEQMPFSELVFMVSRIVQSVNLPVSVDIETGYADTPDEIADNIQQLSHLGVVGINLEDSTVVGARTLQPAESFAQKVKRVKYLLTEKRVLVFLNIRTDAFLLGHEDALRETLYRINLYHAAGADGIFVPGLVHAEDILQVTASTALPVNVMSLPALASFEELQACGVKRVSMGNFGHQAVYRQMENQMQMINTSKSFSSLY
ncbi:isocitrate lyase/phosphoenolpyruvate mutase family protein [Nibribacter ruber]|uniref:Isocitrate lyase/phosphoenolpyruvate mutase family protein n=1 Tax=Nibribacter ruber TaxID=2698458 RepID=A0A6P1P403_9BACT|nr:isocitrate lyase/phosphoenolpyruvate mutase family protein [Nibribacter ruber]QHL89113.1 isocitrate lyase/phosphoenolpyruvate mutase family protein [Nibribacter ruber]